MLCQPWAVSLLVLFKFVCAFKNASNAYSYA
jgi:hypothetical protein